MNIKIKEFLNYEKIVNGNAGTEKYNNVIADYLFKFFDNNDNQLNDTKDLVLYYKQNTNLSNKSINKIIKLLRQVYKHHKIDNADLFDFKLLKEKHNTKRVIKKNELTKIFNYLNNMQDRGNAKDYLMMAYILFDTGVRPNELINIKIDNVNIDKRYIYLDTTKTGIPRHVFMSKDITIKLKDYLKTNNNTTYLFFNNLRNRQYKTKDLKALWTRVKKIQGYLF